MGENDSGNLGWRAALTPDLQNHERLTPIKEVKDLASGYVDLATKYDEAGKKIEGYEGKLKEALFVPGDDATDEVRSAFYAKLGRPESPDKYGIKRPDAWPENLPYDENMEKGFREFAHKMGLPDKSTRLIYEWYTGNFVKAAKAEMESRQKALTEGASTMQKEWGDKFDENSKVTQRAVLAFGGEPFKKFLDDSGLGNHPDFVRTFYNIGKAMMEDKFVDGDKSGPKKEPGKLSYPSMEQK